MKSVKNIQSFFGVLLCMTIFFNCRGNIIPSEEDLSDYGWTLYEANDFAGRSKKPENRKPKSPNELDEVKRHRQMY